MSFAEEYRRSIIYQLDALINTLVRSNVAWDGRVAYTVDEKEWDEVQVYLNRYSYLSPTPTSVVGLNYRGIELVKR